MKRIITIIAVLALVAVLGAVLVACTPSNLKKATKKLEKAEYTVTTMDVPEAYKKAGVDAFFEARKEGNYIEAIHFDTLKQARAYKKDHEKELEEKRTVYAAAFGNDVSVQRVSKWIVIGTEEAISAFKK